MESVGGNIGYCVATGPCSPNKEHDAKGQTSTWNITLLSILLLVVVVVVVLLLYMLLSMCYSEQRKCVFCSVLNPPLSSGAATGVSAAVH
jgi:hypothetical protein